MRTNYSLADLVPEPVTLTDGGPEGTGRVYDVLTPELANPLQMARLRRLEYTMALTLTKQNEALTANDLVQAHALQKDLDALCREKLGVLVPDLPAERLSAIPDWEIRKFLRFWSEEVRSRRAQQQAETPQGEAPAGQ